MAIQKRSSLQKEDVFTPRLFPDDEEPQSDIHPKQKDKDAFSDPAFAANKTLPIHRWVPWIAGFSREFVRNALKEYAPPENGMILDPFAGVGTTLIESMLLHHQTIGFELNPYAALASHTKINASHISIDLLQNEIAQFQKFYSERLLTTQTPFSNPPSGFHTRTPFYSSAVLNKVLFVQDFITNIEKPEIKNLFRLAFAATMISYSNYSYEPSLSRRESSGKENIQDFDVDRAILNKLSDMQSDIVWFRKQLLGSEQHAQIINDSFFNYQKHLVPESIDIIITSPPYLNNYHYNRNTRPQIYWLDYAKKPNDFKPLEEHNFGKYWQTVRSTKRIEINFDLPHSDIFQRLEQIRTLHPEKGVYGGNGWANYAACYFNDCRKFALGIQYLLKPRGYALIVLGNSILQGIHIPTDHYFAQIAKSIGLEVIKIDVPRTTRIGNSIIQSSVRVAKAQDSHQLYEAIVVLRKP